MKILTMCGTKSILRILFFASLLALCATSIALAQQVEISSTLNPVGSGARATGMGGAFIAVADDATAASWNPGGLIQLEKPEMSLVYANFRREQTYHPLSHPEMDTTNRVDTSALNYASVAYPFVLLNRNMIVSLNYQRLYEMDKQVHTALNYTQAGVNGSVDYHFRQTGDLHALSPAFAVQIVPGISAGVTLNLWNDVLGQNGWENTTATVGSFEFGGISFPVNKILYEKDSFSGTNAHLGALWNISGPWTLGVVYKTSFDAKLKKQSSLLDVAAAAPPTAYEENDTMVMPASYGAGIQYRHSDSFTVAFDLYHTEWSDFLIRNAFGSEVNPINSEPLSQGRLRNTTQARLGAEYLFIGNDRVVPVRAGLFYDPEPGVGYVNDFWGFSLGTGFSTPRFALDGSYQYRIGRNVDGDIASIQPKSVDVIQQTLMVSLIYYF